MSSYSDYAPGPTLYWPAGTNARWRLQIKSCRTCPALDLTDAQEVEFIFKRTATTPDASALFTKKLSEGGIVAADLLIGLVDVLIDDTDTTPADGFADWVWITRVTLEDGTVLQPFGLSGAARLDALAPSAEGILAADSTMGTIAPVSLSPAPLPTYATVAYVDAGLATKQPLDADLTAIAALTTQPFGRSVLETADAAALRTLADAQQADADLTALAAVSTNGLLARTGNGTAAARSIAGTAPVTVTNGDGVAGNPTVSVSAATDTATGVVELATSAETVTGTDTTRAVTPACDRAALSAYVDPIALTRTPSSYLQSDGATSNRGVVYSNSTRQNIAGVPTVQIAFEANLVGVTDSTLFASYPTSPFAGSQGNAMAFFIGSVAGLQIQANGTGSSSNNRVFRWAGFYSAYVGQRVRGLITITQGTTNPVVEINGVDVSSNFIASIANTPPQWLDANLSSAFQIAGFNWPAGEMPLVTPILGSLSTTEKTTYFSTGRLPAWVHAGGSAVDRAPTGEAYSFGAADGTSLPTTVGGGGVTFSAVAGARTGGAGAQILQVESNGSGSFSLVSDFGNYTFSKFTYRFWARRTAGSGTTIIFGDSVQASNVLNQVSGISGTWAFFSGSAWGRASSSGSVAIGFVGGSAGDRFELDDVQITVEGALTSPGIQGIGTVRDLTTLGGTQYNHGRMVGVRPVLTQPAPRNIAILPLSTTGAFLTLGSANPLAFTPQRIIRAEVIVDTAGADLTFRRNSSSTNDIVTALTDIPSANTATALTLIAAQTRLAPGETVWGSLSAGTGFIIVETADTL